MIEVLYGMKGIRYRVINEQTGKVLIFANHETAIHYDMHNKIPLWKDSEDPEAIMDTCDLFFSGITFTDCMPRYCNGEYVLMEYLPEGTQDDSTWFVTDMQRKVYALFTLRTQAEKYIHDKE